MFVRIGNVPRPYAWGSLTAISELLGSEAPGGPQAELWLGAHPGSPSRILDPAKTRGAADLASWLAADPATALGSLAPAGRLPFLLKVLAADSPLSLQAHPTTSQAQIGFARENLAGLPVDSPLRNYKDPFAKPELMYALSESFEALCGFRPVGQIQAIVLAMLDADASRAEPQPQPLEDLLGMLGGDHAIERTFEWLVRGSTGVATLVGLVSDLSAGLSAAASGYFAEFSTVRQLAAQYPGDPGIVISLMLNRVSLAKGEALYLPAGNIHAYLSGLGIELMAASDNVLRGGLTPKFIDIDELMSILDFHSVDVPLLHGSQVAPGVMLFRPDVPEFALLAVDGTSIDYTFAPHGPAIVLCTAGSWSIRGDGESIELQRGQSIYVTPDETELSLVGDGSLFVATVNPA
ncbi:MAG: manA [Microbacteriaceae bacterium]|nr:manA [Microbacteriaceae bacterium]